MRRQLPLVELKGTMFFVDVVRDQLREQENPENTISFDFLQQDRDGYSFLYDVKLKNVPADAQQVEDGKRFIKITLGALMELDPEGIALKYGIPIEVLCPEKASAKYQDEDDDDGFYEDF